MEVARRGVVGGDGVSGGVAAAAAVRGVGGGGGGGEAVKAAETMLYFALWYLLNVGYNVYNKKVLNVFPFPWTMSAFQLGTGVLGLLPLWATGLRKAPRLTGQHLANLSPIALMHTFAHLSAVVSLGAGAVSFTHIIKSAEPIFSALASAMFLGQFFRWPVYASLVPVVAGVAAASAKEINFSYVSFGAAMMSNLASALRAIFSKRQMNRPQGENMGAANLYGVLTCISFLMLAPVALLKEWSGLVDGWKAATTSIAAAAGAGAGAAEEAGAAAMSASGYTQQQLLFEMLASGGFYYLYNEVAFRALDSVHPITHAVANTVKRVVIILVTMAYFNNQMTVQGAAGSATAIVGVLFYSIVKHHQAKLAAAAHSHL